MKIENYVRDNFFFALCNGEISKIKDLIVSGADCNQIFATGDRPLHIAIAGRDLILIKILIDSGANPGLLNSQGLSSLAFAWDQAVKNDINMPAEYRVHALNALRVVSNDANPFRM